MFSEVRQKQSRNIALAAMFAAVFFLLINLTAINGITVAICRKVAFEMVDMRLKGYLSTESNHFLLKYKPGIKNLQLVLDAAEEAYTAVSQEMDYKMPQKIQINLFSSFEEMNEVLSMDSNHRAMGVYYAGAINIADPGIWIKKNDAEEFAEVFKKDGPMVHELIHLVVDGKTAGNYPLWFTEGVAVYYENRINGNNYNKNIVYNTEDITINRLMDDFGKLNMELAYEKSRRIISNIVQTYGEEELYGIMKELSENKNADSIFFRSRYDDCYNG